MLGLGCSVGHVGISPKSQGKPGGSGAENGTHEQISIAKYDSDP